MSVRSWVRRRASSWLALFLALAVLAVLGAVAVSRLQSRAHRATVRAAVEDARVITRLTALRNLSGANATEPLTAAERRDLDGDVQQLTAGGDVLKLLIQRWDGGVLYSQGQIPSQYSLPVASGGDPRRPTVSFFDAPGQTAAMTHVVRVVLPTGIGTGPSAVFVAVTVPAATVNAGAEETYLILAIVAAVLFAAGSLVAMRRRYRLRSHQASHDGLTGLGNRGLLEEAAQNLFDAGQPFALLMMDLDGFKRVNDALGHAAGDELLMQVSQSLHHNVRPQDLLVRLGGDEFALLLPGLAAEHAAAAAHRLLDGVRRQFVVCGVTVDCDASVGVAIAHQDGADFGQLLQAADIAMYQAKRHKLGVSLFTDSDGDVDAGDLQTLVDLRAAIDRGELRLHYQPAVSIDNRGGNYLEALLRWQHPTRGLLSPDKFIPLAEDTALIHPMTAWVINEAVRQCAQWRLDGLDTTVAINVSPRSLAHDDLVVTIADALARHQLPAEALHIEITESAVIARPEQARDILTELRRRGVCTSIDDFGAGYTSLAHLKTLPVETLKIDRAFIRDLLRHGSDETVVEAIIKLAHGLGMNVVAEGVEDEPTLQRLVDLGCDIAQGFYLSKPLPADAATRWMRAQPDPVPTGS